MKTDDYYLVHSATCSRCARIARDVERITTGRFKAIPQDDPLIQQARTVIGDKIPDGEPFVLIVGANRTLKVRRGGAMARLIAVRVGVRRSLEVARVLKPNDFSPGRRGVLLGGLVGGVAAAGWLFGTPAVTAAGAGRTLPQADALSRVDSLAHNEDVATAIRDLEAAGCVISEGITSGGQDPDGFIHLVTVYPSSDDPENEAGILIIRRSSDGGIEVAGGMSHRTELSGATDYESRGVVDFAKCVAKSSGGGCYQGVIDCVEEYWPQEWYIVVSCIVGLCGWRSGKAAWDCKGKL